MTKNYFRSQLRLISEFLFLKNYNCKISNKHTISTLSKISFIHQHVNKIKKNLKNNFLFNRPKKFKKKLWYRIAENVLK